MSPLTAHAQRVELVIGLLGSQGETGPEIVANSRSLMAFCRETQLPEVTDTIASQRRLLAAMESTRDAWIEACRETRELVSD